MKLNVRAFGFTCALFLGVGLFLLTWWIILFQKATAEVTFVGKVYRGYSITPLGSVIGLVWGLADGFIAGMIFAWLYNRFSGKKK
jgi:hypothetical protein